MRRTESEDISQRGFRFQTHVPSDQGGINKWTMPILKWKEAFAHFAILFEERMPK